MRQLRCTEGGGTLELHPLHFALVVLLEFLELEEKAVVLRGHSAAATLLLLQQAENVPVPPAPLFYLRSVLLVEPCPSVVMQARTSLGSALAFGHTARGGAGMGRR